MGTVNNASFPPSATKRQFKAEAETLLFIAAAYRRIITVTGAKAYELSYKFAHRLVKTKTSLAVFDVRAANVFAGWNRHFVTEDADGVAVNDWVKILSVNGDKATYESSDFRKIFNPRSP